MKWIFASKNVPTAWLARPEGLEPPPSKFEACGSIHLSYGRILLVYHRISVTLIMVGKNNEIDNHAKLRWSQKHRAGALQMARTHWNVHQSGAIAIGPREHES